MDSPASSQRKQGVPASDFERVYRAELPVVWRFVSRLGVAQASLEDLVHEVFITAWQRWSTYDASRPVRPWLFGIAVRKAADHRALRRHVVEVAESDHDAGHDGPDVAGKVDAERILQQALARMSDEGRAVFVMHELEERAVPEIAEVMGTPVPTAYTRLRAARQLFAETVQQLKEGAR